MNQAQKIAGGQVEINREWCKGCGLCISACPKGVLSQDKMGKAQVDAPENCAGCGVCEATCPDFAITVRLIKYA